MLGGGVLLAKECEVPAPTRLRYCCENGAKCFNEYMRPRFQLFEDIFDTKNTKMNFTDIDGFMEVRGTTITQEWKRPGERLPTAQRISMETLVKYDPRAVGFVFWGDTREMEPESFMRIDKDGWSKQVACSQQLMLEMVGDWFRGVRLTPRRF